MEKSVEDLNRDLRSQVGPMEKEAAAIRRQMAEIEEATQRYVKALGKGTVSLDRLEREIEAGDNGKRQLSVRLEVLTRQINDHEVSTFNADLVRKSLRDFQACFYALPPAEQTEALQCVVKNVILERDKIVLEIFELPEFVPGSTNRSKWYPRQDSNLLPSA